MTTKDPAELIRKLPPEVRELLLAVSVLSSRIDSLPKADQSDLFRLLLARGKAADEEEREAIESAMIEILTHGKVATKPVPPPDDCALPERTFNWAKYVGGRIRQLREKAGLTQVQLAEKAGLPQSHISRLENAEHSATHLTLERIATALGVAVGDIDPCAD